MCIRDRTSNEAVLFTCISSRALGRAVISAGDQIQIETQESGGQVNRATLTIYKIGGNDIANLLQDVLFDLFRYEKQEDGGYAWVRTDLTAKGEEAEDVYKRQGHSSM